MMLLCRSGHRYFKDGEDTFFHFEIRGEEAERRRSEFVPCEFSLDFYSAAYKDKLVLDRNNVNMAYYICKQCSYDCIHAIIRSYIPPPIIKDLVSRERWA